MSKRPSNDLSLPDLRRELKRRSRQSERRAIALQKRRGRLLKKVAAIDAELAGLGATAGTGQGRKRPRNDSNLADALAALLARRTLSVTGAAEEVQKAGYTTTSPNFRTIVNQTLIKDQRFKRVGRGRYTAGK